MKNFYFLLIILLMIPLLMVSCENDLEKVNIIAAQKDPAIEYGFDVEMFYSTKGLKKARLMAPKVLSYREQNPYTEFTEGLNVFFYNEEGETDSELNAKYGIHNHEEKTIIVRNDVVVVNTKGETLNTEELVWKQDEHKIYSDKFVKITRADEIIFGEGFESNEEFTEYTIKKIKGTISVETGEE